MFSAAPLLFPLYFQTMTFRHAYLRKKYLDLATMLPMYIIHFFVTYSAFRSISTTLAYFLLMRMCESAWFTWVSQCNHIVMDVHVDDSTDSWLNLQVTSLTLKHSILNSYKIIFS